MMDRLLNYRIFVLLLGFLFFLSFCKCHGYSKENSVDEIILGYSKSIQKLENITFSYIVESSVEGQFQEIAVGKIITDQKNVLHSFTMNHTNLDQKVRHEEVVAPEWNKFFRVARNDQGEPIVISCYEAENIPDTSQTLGPMSFLFGKCLFQDYVYFPDIVKKLPSKDITVIDNTPLKEIHFDYQGYQYQIRLDTDSFTLIFFGKKILSRKTDAYETESYSFEVLKTQVINEVVFPTQFEIVHSLSAGTIGDGDIKVQVPREKTIYRYSLNDITFDVLSEKDFQLSINLPNGTPVSMQDAPQIDYVWMDGKIVAKTDEVALRIARGDHGFMPGPKNPRLWLMILGAVLLLVGGGLKIRTMLKSEG